MHDDDRDERGHAPDGLDLGRLLRSDDSRTGGRIDVDAVIRRSRRRRGARLAGLTTAWVLAGTLVIGGGVVGLRQLSVGIGSGSAGSAASGSADGKSDGAGAVAPSTAPLTEDAADPRCGSPVPVSSPGAGGLVAAIALPTATTASGATTTATVTLTNTSSSPVVGSVEQPRAVLARKGVVTWHSPVVPTTAPRSIRLAAGSSTSFTVEILAGLCTIGSDDPASAAPAPSGGYSALATIVVHLAAGDEVIVSEAAQLRIP